MKYLEVSFYDNDFGWGMRDALKRLWVYINKNNGHLVARKNTSIPELFVFLHENKRLLPMIKYLYSLEYLAFSVEFATRGIYNRGDKFFSFNDVPETIEDPKLDCEIVAFHKNKKFSRKWSNGESAWLNLIDGSADTF